MFFQLDRIVAVRQMILADNPEERQKALAQIIPMQRQDFLDILRLMDGLPLTVRLLDPPLHEFLPRGESEVDQLAHALKRPVGAIRHRIAELHETNPMLGLRGCRLGVTAPEIYQAQLESLVLAALQALSEGVPVSLEIMVPFISLAGEFRFLREMVDHQIAKVLKRLQATLPYQVGTMIELPRAALKAGKIAQYADFISFGTNDLTQTTFGFSRDDAASFLSLYRQKGLVDRDPFMSLDQSGVGELIQLAIQRARASKPHIKVGVCGEQGADPSSIQFFENVGVDYVSCSPYRLPVARLSAAQASLQGKQAPQAL
jgi:pyruvate,orthophosphate dikinase